MKIRKNILVMALCGVAVIACFVNVAVAGKKKNGGPGKGMKPAAVNAGPVSVRTVKAEKKTLRDYVNTNGEIECASSIDVFGDIGGKVSKVYVGLGTYVKKGAIICEIDPNEVGTYYVNSKVYAPVSGTITASPKEVGTKVSTSTAITTIGNVSKLQVRVRVAEKYVAALRKGLDAKIVLEAYPDEVFDAHVSEVSPVVDSESRTKEVVLKFDHPDPKVNAGMFAKVKLYTLDYADEIVVPVAALVEKRDKFYLYVAGKGKKNVKQVEVIRGRSVDGEIQILEGLEEGQSVVTEGMRALTDGAEIIDLSKPKKSRRSEISGDEESPAPAKVKDADKDEAGEKAAPEEKKKSSGRRKEK